MLRLRRQYLCGRHKKTKMLNNDLYWLWLQGVLGYADVRIHTVLETYRSAEAFYYAPQAERIKCCGLTPLQITRASKLKLSDFESILEECTNSGIKIINILNSRYPKRLFNIPNPPTVIYVKGELPCIDNEAAITIVGPREEKISKLGKKSAYALGLRLTLAGCLVISGGATGADRCAHIGALRAGGKTVAVLGCGINNNYLKVNADLREAISQNGCLISEYPPSISATKATFPVRNRILAALSLGTVVVEAGEKSGALITATHAAEQGKEVFAVPGSISDKCYIGTNKLIQDGAKPLLTVADIFEEYIALYPDKIDVKKAFSTPKGAEKLPDDKMPEKKEVEKQAESKAKLQDDEPKEIDASVKNQVDLSMLSADAVKVFGAINKSPFFADEVIALSGVEPSGALAAITELEIYRIITAIPGGRYKIT